MFDDVIKDRFGGRRALVRTVHFVAKGRLGVLHGLRRPDPTEISRVVFVCSGNICRSPFAHYAALQMGVSAASCGINASTGDAPHPLAVRCAAKRGLDITAHRATHIDRFDVLVGDLVLSFEPGHHHVLKERLGEAPGVKLCLLGAWLIPVFPYFHDPDGVNERYFDVCFLRIDRAVRNLAAWLREGRSV